MSTQPKQAKGKSSVCPCPQGCGFSQHEKDFHKACPACLGIVHARRALTELKSCESCLQLQGLTLERRVKFVERVLGKTAVTQHGPLLSEMRDPALSEFGGEELLVGDPIGSWADHMECIPLVPRSLRMDLRLHCARMWRIWLRLSPQPIAL